MESFAGMVLGTYPSWSHLVVRVVLGVIFFAHGAQKLFGWFGGMGFSKTIAGFKAIGVPPAAATAAGLIEGVGGAAMIVGVLARPTALGFIAVMLVAMVRVHARHGFFLNVSLVPGRGHGIEYNLALAAMALSILIGGAGEWSIDRCLAPWGR